MIETRMLAFLEPNDKDALQDWARQHMEWHQLVYTEAVKQGFKRYDIYPLLRDIEDFEGWSYFHSLEHQNIASSLGTQTTDLTDLTPDDRDVWADWMDVHASIHTDLRTILKII